MAGRLSMATERLASAMRPLPTSSFGYPVREPVPSEQAFFALNPNVGGYAAEDGAVVLNEGARSGDRYLSNRELGGVARNEASRLYMRDRSIVPDFSLTKDQELEFQGTAYGSNPEALKQSIAARIITGDQSAGETTKEQREFSQDLLKQMEGIQAPKKQGIIARVGERLKQALDGLFDDPAPSSPQFPESSPQPPPEPTITISKSRTPSNPETREPLGKITSYNWQGDPYTDTNSRNLVGSFGKLTQEGVAVSPDIEKQFRDQGIKPKDKVLITLSDGTTMERRWEDRTMGDKQAIRKFGKPLKGRFDLHYPEGKSPHEKDGIAVVGFQKLVSAE